MKKKFLLFLITISFLTIIFTSSCEKNEDINISQDQILSDPELTKLFSSIDSLNTVYTLKSSTRGALLDKWTRRVMCGLFDACVGGLTAETGPGALVFSTVASGLYDDYLDYIMRRIPQKSRYSSRSETSVSKKIVFPIESATFVDSIGFYHNTILEDIQPKMLSVIDNNGNINYAGYYNEVLAASKKYGISDSIEANNTLVFCYIESIIRPLAQIDEVNIDSIMPILFNETYNDFHFNNYKTTVLRNIFEQIVYNDLCMDVNQLIDYGIEVNNMILTSNVSDDIKNIMRITHSIAVNSSLYWNSKLYEISD